MRFLIVYDVVLKNANTVNRNIIGFHPIIIDVMKILIVLESVTITFNERAMAGARGINSCRREHERSSLVFPY